MPEKENQNAEAPLRRQRSDYVVDTNVLIRTQQPDTQPREYQAARDAIAGLVLRGNILHVTPLILVEFWSVLTRNAPAGVGMDAIRAQREMTQIRTLFTLLPDTPEVLEEWQEIVVQHGVTGIDVYDAYIAATLRVHRIPRLLTFNAADFRRFGPFRVVHPTEVSGGPADEPV